MRLRRIVMPETAKRGEIVEIRAMIAHPMIRGHSGSGGPAQPRRIIHSFVVHYGEREIFRAELFAGIAANPMIVIRAEATETDDVRFTWTEDGGQTAVETRTLTVRPA